MIDGDFQALVTSDEYDFVYKYGISIPLSDAIKLKDDVNDGLVSHFAVVSCS